MQIVKNFAPVLIPTLCRYEHFKRCVESLSRCTHADKTVLYIALDYPLKESHRAGYEKIKSFIPSITGFKDVVVIERDKNFGAHKNIVTAKEVIYQKYDSYIFTEDDNEFSPNFLDYINKGLEKYKDDDRVYSISGYNFPVDMSGYEKNVYAHYEFSAWGVGLWKNKRVIEWTENDVKAVLKSFWKVFRIWKVEPRILLSLTGMIQRNSFGDTLDVAKCILEDKVSIFPKMSLVRNWGQDGSGVHCGSADKDKFEGQVIDDSEYFDYDDISLKSIKIGSLSKYLDINTIAKFSTIKRYFKWLLQYK